VSSLRIVQLSKRFGAVSALDEVSLELGAGEMLVVAGPSGSGKSTLLRLVAGLEVPTQGEIHLGAERFDTLSAERRAVALIGQNPALLPQLNVVENLGLGLRLRKVPRDDANRRVHEAAERLGLAGLLQRLPAELSGGEQQRVALGRVLVSRPKLLLLDEPLAQLDPELKRGLRREIQRLHRELKVPAILVTHDQEEAMELADRIAVLRTGRLEQAGSPDQIHRSPVNPFVAEFFSPAGFNRLDGRIERDAEGRWFCVGDLRLNLPAASGNEADGGRHVLFLRPEAIHVFSGSSEVPNEMPGRISRVVSLGWERRLELEAGGLVLRVRSVELPSFAVGDWVRWSVDWTRALWFPAGY
jgi:ABC-type sugar transport system ATPase subunit